MIRRKPKTGPWDKAMEGRLDGTEDPKRLRWDQYGAKQATQGALIWFVITILAIVWLLKGPKFP